MEKQIIKPITLLRNDFALNLVDLCNNSGLPFFVVEDVLRGVVEEVHNASVKQYETDLSEYNKTISNVEEGNNTGGVKNE